MGLCDSLGTNKNHWKNDEYENCKQITRQQEGIFNLRARVYLNKENPHKKLWNSSCKLTDSTVGLAADKCLAYGTILPDIFIFSDSKLPLACSSTNFQKNILPFKQTRIFLMRLWLTSRSSPGKRRGRQHRVQNDSRIENWPVLYHSLEGPQYQPCNPRRSLLRGICCRSGWSPRPSTSTLTPDLLQEINWTLFLSYTCFLLKKKKKEIKKPWNNSRHSVMPL